MKLLDKLTPQQKKYLALIIGIGGIVGILYLFSSESKPRIRNNEVESVLTNVSAKDIGIESLIAQIKISNDNLKKLENELKKVSKEQDLVRAESTANRTAINRIGRLEKDFTETSQRLEESVKVLSEKLSKATEENVKLKKELKEIEKKTNSTKTTDSNKTRKSFNETIEKETQVTNKRPTFSEIMQAQSTAKEEFIDKNVNLSDVEALYAQAPLPAEKDESFEIAANISTNLIAEADDITESQELDTIKQDIFIPAGSMLKGVLLAGLDAPTGTNARKDPFPVQVRIQKDAILPNGFTADLKECFLLMSGYGEMSSERALLRGENLSCIKDDGSIIQTKLPSYAAGEDGKAGIRGRLVSKTGSILAKTLLAGFASGVSQAFDVNMTPTINTSSDGTVSYEQVYSPDAFQGAAVKGVSNALDKLADYYMSMAEEMFPIIEIDGGREVTVIVTNGATLTTVRDAQGKSTAQNTVVTDKNKKG